MANRRGINDLREGIDSLDRQLVELLGNRAALAREIGDLKRTRGLPFHDPRREGSVVSHLQGINAGRFPERALDAVYTEIFSACLSLEDPLQVAFPGGRDGFVHEAALGRFGISCRYVAEPNPVRALRRLASGEAHYALLPLENSISGLRLDSLDALAERPLPIVEEILHQPRIRLYGFEDGHPAFIGGEPELLRVCEGALEQLYPRVQLIPSENLPELAEHILREKRGVLLAGERLGREFDLPLTLDDLEPAEHYIDRYLLLGEETRPPSGDDKTSLFAMLPHRPGSLLDLLSIIADHGIDLLALDSRPSRGLPWHYRFFLELKGHGQEPPLSAALAEAATRSLELAVLGSYPRAKEQ